MDTISLEELHKLYSNHSGVIIDVRDKDEFANGHIPGSINIPHSQLKERLAEIPQEKPLYVICEKGGRSIGAATVLSLNKISASCVLPGGVFNWKEKGFPIARV
ncbi:MAG: rhodanese-like domain-containing protein [Arenicella sp.]